MKMRLFLHLPSMKKKSKESFIPEQIQLPTSTPEPSSSSSTDSLIDSSTHNLSIEHPTNQPFEHSSTNQQPSRPRRFASTPQASRDIKSNIDETNILPKGMTKKRIRKQLHAADLENSSNLSAYHKTFSFLAASRNYYSSAFSSKPSSSESSSSEHSSSEFSTNNLALPSNSDASTPQRFHRDNLPPEPQNFKQMLKHPHNSDFMQALHIKIDALTAKNV